MFFQKTGYYILLCHWRKGILVELSNDKSLTIRSAFFSDDETPHLTLGICVLREDRPMGRRPEESEAWPSQTLDALSTSTGYCWKAQVLPHAAAIGDWMGLVRFLLTAVQHLHKHRTPAEPGRFLDRDKGHKIQKGKPQDIASRVFNTKSYQN